MSEEKSKLQKVTDADAEADARRAIEAILICLLYTSDAADDMQV